MNKDRVVFPSSFRLHPSALSNANLALSFNHSRGGHFCSGFPRYYCLPDCILSSQFLNERVDIRRSWFASASYWSGKSDINYPREK